MNADFRIHLLGVPPDEAEASLDAHGHPDTCCHEGCTEDLVAMVLIRDGAPGSSKGGGLCATHEAEFLEQIHRSPGYQGA